VDVGVVKTVSAVVELPAAHSTPSHRTRDGGGAVTVAVNLIHCVLTPPPIYGAARQGPTGRVILGWTPPIRAWIRARVGHWANSVEINLTFSPLI
jgi:hypothetical protein